MIGKSVHMTESTLEQAPTLSDPLADVLRMVRLTGGIFLDARFSEPWCVTAAMTPDSCSGYIRAARQIIGYHFVAEGSMYLSIDKQNVMRLGAGDIVLLPRNDVHTVASSHELSTRPGVSFSGMLPGDSGL